MRFRYNLKIARENKGLSIKALANAINVKPYTISDWEKGRSEPSISNLIKLAQCLNVTIDFLVGNAIQNTENYDEIVNLINKFQESNHSDEFHQLLGDLTPKNQEKLINIIKTIKKEIFNK